MSNEKKEVKYRKVSFQLFFTCSYLSDADDENPAYENIKPLFGEIDELYKSDNGYKEVYNYNMDPIRIKELDDDDVNGYYHIVIERLDDTVLSKTTIYGESEDLPLDEEEYIGHEINILYDYHNDLMLLQNNVSSLSRKGIELFINSLLFDYKKDEDFDIYFLLVPAIDKKSFRKAKDKKVFSTLGVEITGKENNDYGLFNLEKEFDNIGSIEITIKSKSKKEPLKRETTVDFLEQWSGSEIPKKLWIKGRDDEDDQLELINLLKQTVKFYYDFEYEKGVRLSSNSIYYEMKRMYDEFKVNLGDLN